MIIDVAKFRTQEDRADCELRFVLLRQVNSTLNLLIPLAANYSVHPIQVSKLLRVPTFSHHYDGTDPVIFDRRYCVTPMKILPMAMTIFSNHL